MFKYFLTISACLTCVVLAHGLAAEQEVGRKISTKESLKRTALQYAVKPGEHVLMARIRKGETDAYPLLGYVFPKNSDELALGLRVDIRRPRSAESGEWQIHVGPEDKKAYSTAGYTEDPIKNERRASIRSISVPLQVSGVDVYMVPYRVVDNEVESLVLVFSLDREKIKKCLKWNPDKKFDWEKGFKEIPPKPIF